MARMDLLRWSDRSGSTRTCLIAWGGRRKHISKGPFCFARHACQIANEVVVGTGEEM